ncbi:hypothetical protein HanHA89_Chr07g0276581 [Helianthus annuus]|nr:hypothetical protein HanHA89_Chr07g0276581 [Helianthus annuus]
MITKGNEDDIAGEASWRGMAPLGPVYEGAIGRYVVRGRYIRPDYRWTKNWFHLIASFPILDFYIEDNDIHQEILFK